jgi:hypothetical protein
MSEIWIRAGLVAGALALAAAAAILRRARSRRSREVSAGGLGVGVYLLTSSSCPTCGPARQRVIDAVGEGGFIELSWESDPGAFRDSGVDTVPSLLVVEGSGRARLYPGASSKALSSL